MSDRELLELAAKAAGVALAFTNFTSSPIDFDTGRDWKPLTDDGDALRLAVKLELQVCVGTARDMETGFIEVVGEETDKYSATRRAIVRAAAEIGRNMK